MPAPMSDDLCRAAVDTYLAGATLQETADAYCVSNMAVHRWLLAAGEVTRRKRGRFERAWAAERAQELRDIGLSYAQIGRALGLSQETIRKWMRAKRRQR